jgi:hypothetical protein
MTLLDLPHGKTQINESQKFNATDRAAHTRYRKRQALHARMKARKAAAKQKRDASAQSEGEQMEDGEAEPQQACQLWLLMELVRELQTPTQNATTTQETYSRETEAEQPQMEVTETAAEPEEEQETEEEQSQMEVTEADAEPEADQEEADQMRDTGEVSAAAETPPAVEVGFEPPPGWEQWDMQRRRMHKKRQREIQRRGSRGDQGSLG